MKIKGLKKAVGKRNEWINRSYSNIANIMINKASGQIWCDCFTTADSYIMYRDSNIIKINTLCDKYNMPMTMVGIKISLLSEHYRGDMPLFENIEKELIDYAK